MTNKEYVASLEQTIKYFEVESFPLLAYLGRTTINEVTLREQLCMAHIWGEDDKRYKNYVSMLETKGDYTRHDIELFKENARRFKKALTLRLLFSQYNIIGDRIPEPPPINGIVTFADIIDKGKPQNFIDILKQKTEEYHVRYSVFAGGEIPSKLLLITTDIFLHPEPAIGLISPNTIFAIPDNTVYLALYDNQEGAQMEIYERGPNMITLVMRLFYSLEVRHNAPVIVFNVDMPEENDEELV